MKLWPHHHDPIAQLIERAVEAGIVLHRGCELEEVEQSPAANGACSESKSKQQGYTHSNGYDG